MNDKEREQWVSNDEGLYNWQRTSGLTMRSFLRKHRNEIDAVILNVRDGRKPAHYLAYGSKGAQP
jgi:hypothetical protein